MWQICYNRAEDGLIDADSGHRDQPIRLIVITQTGDRDHAAHQGRGGAWRAAWGGIGRHH
jgi:hypothetical protein